MCVRLCATYRIAAIASALLCLTLTPLSFSRICRYRQPHAVLPAAPSPAVPNRSSVFGGINPLVARADGGNVPLAVVALQPTTAAATDGTGQLARAAGTASVEKLRLWTCCVTPAVRTCYACARDQQQHTAWFETTVLIRKAAIVLIACFIPNALAQTAAFELLFLLFVVLQISLRPYVAWRHQFAEGLSLVCIMATAALAILAQPTAGNSATTATVVTAIMLVLNVGTVAFLAQQYVLLSCVRNAKQITGAVRVLQGRRPPEVAQQLQPETASAHHGNVHGTTGKRTPHSLVRVSLSPLAPALQLAASTAALNGSGGALLATKLRMDTGRRLRAASQRLSDGGVISEAKSTDDNHPGECADDFQIQPVANPLSLGADLGSSSSTLSDGRARGGGGSSTNGSSVVSRAADNRHAAGHPVRHTFAAAPT